MLAPVAGKVPGATFVPQYVNLYGWLLVPLRHFLSPRDLAQTAMILLSCFAVLSVVLAVMIALRDVVAVPLVCGGRHHSAYLRDRSAHDDSMELDRVGAAGAADSSVSSNTAVVPRARGTRSFGQAPSRDGTSRRSGVLAGLIAWNCQDFGVAIAIAFIRHSRRRAPVGEIPKVVVTLGGRSHRRLGRLSRLDPAGGHTDPTRPNCAIRKSVRKWIRSGPHPGARSGSHSAAPYPLERLRRLVPSLAPPPRRAR